MKHIAFVVNDKKQRVYSYAILSTMNTHKAIVCRAHVHYLFLIFVLVTISIHYIYVHLRSLR